MLNTLYLYCPKCNGTNIKAEPIEPDYTLRISLDDIAKKHPVGVLMSDPLVLEVMGGWQATCKDCGYSVEFDAPVPTRR